MVDCSITSNYLTMSGWLAQHTLQFCCAVCSSAAVLLLLLQAPEGAPRVAVLTSDIVTINSCINQVTDAADIKQLSLHKQHVHAGCQATRTCFT